MVTPRVDAAERSAKTTPIATKAVAMNGVAATSTIAGAQKPVRWPRTTAAPDQTTTPMNTIGQRRRARSTSIPPGILEAPLATACRASSKPTCALGSRKASFPKIGRNAPTVPQASEAATSPITTGTKAVWVNSERSGSRSASPRRDDWRVPLAARDGEDEQRGRHRQVGPDIEPVQQHAGDGRTYEETRLHREGEPPHRAAEPAALHRFGHR